MSTTTNKAIKEASEQSYIGMSKREHMALAMLQSLIINGDSRNFVASDGKKYTSLEELAVVFADELIVELDKRRV